MQRIIFSVVVIVVIAALGLPPVFGVLTERRITQQLADGGGDPNVAVHIDRYQRGWYRSSAILQVRPSAAYLATIEETLAPDEDETDDARRQREEMLAVMAQGCDLDVDMVHGPVGVYSKPFIGLAALQGRVDSDTPKLAEIQRVLGVPYLLRVSALLGFGGSTVFSGDVPEFHVDRDDMNLDFSGLDFSGSYAAPDRDVHMTMRVRPGSYSDEDAVVMLAGAELTFDGNLLDNDFWVGAAQVRVGAFSLAPAALASKASEASEALFELAQLDVRTHTRLNDVGDQVLTTFNYTLDRLDGAALPTIEQVRIGAEIDRLDRQALQRYAAAARSLGVASEHDMALASAEFSAAVHQLLAGSPMMTLEPLSFTVDGDAVDAHLALSVEPSMLPPAAQLFTGDPASWVGLFAGSGRFSIAETLAYRLAEGLALSQLQTSVPPDSEVSAEQLQLLAAQQSRLVIAGLLQQGMLVQEDANIVSEFQYGDGAIVINGVAVPLR